MLLHYIDELESKRPALLDFKAIDDKDLLTALILNNPDTSSKKIMQLYGLSKALDAFNIRELRSMLSIQNQRDWHRLILDAKEVNMPGSLSPFAGIRKHLTTLKPMKMEEN